MASVWLRSISAVAESSSCSQLDLPLAQLARPLHLLRLLSLPLHGGFAMTMTDAPHPRPTLEQPGQLLQLVQPVSMVERHATARRGGVLAAILVGLMVALFLSALDQTI